MRQLQQCGGDGSLNAIHPEPRLASQACDNTITRPLQTKALKLILHRHQSLGPALTGVAHSYQLCHVFNNNFRFCDMQVGRAPQSINTIMQASPRMSLLLLLCESLPLFALLFLLRAPGSPSRCTTDDQDWQRECSKAQSREQHECPSCPDGVVQDSDDRSSDCAEQASHQVKLQQSDTARRGHAGLYD